MQKEIEAKFRLPDPEPLRAQLSASGAVRLGRVLEVNRLFDAPDGRLKSAGCGLRVRSWQSLDGDGATGATLTFKGPRDASEYKSREEIETAVADANAAITIVQRLGLRERLVFEKRREAWKLHECEVTLDELPLLGWYLEIEGPDADAVTRIRQQLQLAETPLASKTYPHLAYKHGVPCEDGRRELRFDE